ncbi:MAG: DUF3050 domain-containing protein [Nitrosomonadales bacterium]|nr:DUF3050 domain-containing protein [Nitrosomonadales bacterium]
MQTRFDTSILTPLRSSHFELYCRAMTEIGADPSVVQTFVSKAAASGIEAVFTLDSAPGAAREFMESTFGFLAGGKPHRVAAAFAMGRDTGSYQLRTVQAESRPCVKGKHCFANAEL